MADIDFDEYGQTPRFSGQQAQRLFHLAGAACSVALILGLGVWGYRLAVRDVSGIPVMRAVEGPMRVAPDNPGGEVADHQGMAVNIVASVGTAGAMPDEIVLAPAPLDLAEEDAPGLSAPLPAPEPVLELTAPAYGVDPQTVAKPKPEETAAPAPAVVSAEPQTPEVVEPPMVAATEAPVENLAPAEVAATPMVNADSLFPVDDSALVFDPTQPALPAAAPEVQTVESTDEAVALALAAEIGVEEDPGDGLARSPRPQSRPARMSEAAAVTNMETVAAPSTFAEVDSSTLAAGTRLVQLGAFDTPELAKGEWAKLADRFGDLMTAKSIVVQAAESGGRTFYRLRAHGFDGEDDARRFCAALLAEDAACIPVAHR